MFGLDLLPISPTFFEILMFCYGAIIGSFLNVYIYRFHTGKSLAGRSHCLSCGRVLRAFELIPLISYLGIGGRCRTCHSWVTPRYFIVEAVTGLLFVWSALIAHTVTELLYLCVVCSVLVVIVVYDIRHYIIPDSLTVTLTVLAAVWLGWQYAGGLLALDVLYTVGGATAASGFLFLLWFVSRGRWIGFGDVKLAFPLGLIVGASNVFSMMVLSFWIGAGVSVLLVAAAKLQRGKLRLRFLPATLTIKSVVPFAPFLVAGCLVVLFTHFNVLTLFTF